MKKSIIERELAMELVVGAFMVLVFVGLAFFTIILSRDTWWSNKYGIEVRFSDVMGLRDGDNVVVRGMPVGKVKSLALEKDGVHVLASLDQPLECREGYKASIVTTSMLGGRHMEIDEGPATGRVMRAGEILTGEAPRDLVADAAEAVYAIRKSLVDGGVMDNLQETSRQVREISERLNAGEGTLGKLLSKDDQMYRDLSETVASLKNMANQIDAGKGMFGRLMKDDSMYNELMKAIDELRGWIDDSRETSPVVNFATLFFGAF